MVDETNFVIETNHELGEIVIAPEVIEVIIGIAASKVEGVYRFYKGFGAGLRSYYLIKRFRPTFLKGKL